MKKCLVLIGSVLFATFMSCAEQICVGGVCYLSEEAAREAGVSEADIKAAKEAHAKGEDPAANTFSLDNLDDPGETPPAEVKPTEKPVAKTAEPTKPAADAKAVPGVRVAMGYMNPAKLVAFLKNEAAGVELEDHSLLMILLLVLVGGLAANLTPCVLPLVPVNLILVGKGWKRGLAYGLGITCAYGALGCAAAFGGMAFGTIQSNPWFNVVTATIFTILALAMFGVFFIDLSKFRPKAKRTPAKKKDPNAAPQLRGYWGCFFLGAGAAALAGACVEPILLATLLLTAKWCAAGKMWAVGLPFVLGAGLGLPWPFAAAGFSVLPKPGAWMKWVNRAFGLVFIGMAVWYGVLASRGFRAQAETVASEAGVQAATPATWAQTFDEAKKAGKPVFVDVWATWCKNCLAMEKTTFKDPAVQKELAAFTVIRLQAEKPDEFAKLADFKDLDIKGFPAFIIFGK